MSKRRVLNLEPRIGIQQSGDLTLYGLGTRIVCVSYMAFSPKASPSNIDGPMFLKPFGISTSTR